MKDYAMWLMFFLLGFTTNLAFNNSKEDKLKDLEIEKLKREIRLINLYTERTELKIKELQNFK